MLAVNLGTRGVIEAVDLLEYANIRGGTKLAEQRIANGRTEPFGVGTSGAWAMRWTVRGSSATGSAEDYGKLASQTAKAYAAARPVIKLVVCGSSSADMPTFGEWERVVLTHTYERYRLHIRATLTTRRKTATSAGFLASAVDLDVLHRGRRCDGPIMWRAVLGKRVRPL